MLKAADRSSRMTTDDLESALTIRRASLSDSRAVSDEGLHLNPDWLTSSWLFYERKEDTWLKTTLSSVFTTNERRMTGLYSSAMFNVGFFKQWGYLSLLKCSGKCL